MFQFIFYCTSIAEIPLTLRFTVMLSGEFSQNLLESIEGTRSRCNCTPLVIFRIFVFVRRDAKSKGDEFICHPSVFKQGQSCFKNREFLLRRKKTRIAKNSNPVFLCLFKPTIALQLSHEKGQISLQLIWFMWLL